MKLTYTELVEGVLNPLTGNDRDTEIASQNKPPIPGGPVINPVSGRGMQTSPQRYETTPTALDQFKQKMQSNQILSSVKRDTPQDQSEEWLKGMAGWKSSTKSGGLSVAQSREKALFDQELKAWQNAPRDPVTGAVIGIQHPAFKTHIGTSHSAFDAFGSPTLNR